MRQTFYVAVWNHNDGSDCDKDRHHPTVLLDKTDKVDVNKEMIILIKQFSKYTCRKTKTQRIVTRRNFKKPCSEFDLNICLNLD